MSEPTEVLQLSPGLAPTKDRVRAAIDHFPDSFTLDDLVDQSIFLAELDERGEDVDRWEAIPHAGVMASARAMLQEMQ